MDDKLLETAFSRLIKLLNENVATVSNLSSEAGEKLRRFGDLLEELKSMIIPKYSEALRKLENFDKTKEKEKTISESRSADQWQLVSSRQQEFETTEDISTPHATAKSNTVKTDAFSGVMPLEEPPLVEKRSAKRHSSLREIQDGQANHHENGIIANLLKENEELKAKCVNLQKRYNKLFEAKTCLELTKRSQAVQIKELSNRLDSVLPKEERSQGGVRYEERKRSLLPVEVPRSFSFFLKKLAIEEEENNLLLSEKKLTATKKGPSLSMLIANNLMRNREPDCEEDNNETGPSRYIGQLHFDNIDLNSPTSIRNHEVSPLCHYHEVSIQSSLMKMSCPEGFSSLRKELVDRLPREDKGGRTQFPKLQKTNKKAPGKALFCCHD